MLFTASLLAYAIYPLVTFFRPFLPRLLATLLVYLGMLILLVVFLSNLLIAAIDGINAMIHQSQVILYTQWRGGSSSMLWLSVVGSR
jgi:predicted PurR-regulated permease PerM